MSDKLELTVKLKWWMAFLPWMLLKRFIKAKKVDTYGR